MSSGSVILLLAVLALAVFLAVKFGKHFKRIRCGAFVSFTGGVKCGKSTVSLNVALREYKARRRAYLVRKVFGKKDEEPLLYSNIPLAVPYVPLTRELLLREKRFNYKSVIFIDEASLVADSMSFKDDTINDNLRDFTKLIAHETRGGCLIWNSHCIGDLHFAFKRTTSQYFYIDRLIKWIPFVCVARIVEQRYSEDGSILTVDTEDVASKYRWYVFSKKTWKYFDCYAFSKITDHLQVDKSVCKSNLDLSTDKIIRFRK